ncbi:MAG TPA: outer membrane beta-barrel protein [Bacteroidia bacterium]|jgi:hypothetical protein|nr:outer membrane beta-barrel protein [Bacteroidia bacterium]
MKRLTLLLLLIFPYLQYSNAQIFRAGFYAGASVSDMPGTDNIDNDADYKHLGFVVAGTVSAKISPKTIMQMEIRYIQKGAQQTPAYDTTYGVTGNITGIGLNDYFTLTLNYVDVVIGFKRQIHFNLHNVATDRYGIEAGASIGALISYSYSTQSIPTPIDLNALDISPYIGIYYNITPHFYIEGRYSNSINSALQHDNNNGGSFYNFYYGTWNAGHNIGFTFTLGFIFGGSSSNQPAGNTPPPPPPTDNE